MKIAIVGTGISGLAAAWLLRQHAEVTVYEKNAYAGGHTNTVAVREDGREIAIDTGFIVFNEHNYPNLTAFFHRLGVASHASEMSFSASIDGGQVEWSGDNLNTLFAQRRNLVSGGHWRMLRDIWRFNRDGKRALREGLDAHISLGQFLDVRGYGRELRYRYLLPMAAAIWSSPMDRILEFSATSFLAFCENHGLLNLVDRPQWRTVTGGAREYVRRILQPLEGRVFLGRAVTSIRRDASGVVISDVHGGRERYDQVVMAAHGDETLGLLADADGAERRLLAPFRYQPNRAVLHTDAQLMPKSRRVWASWNYFADGPQREGAQVCLTYWMNRLQKLPSRRQYFVTLNPMRKPAPGSVLYEAQYQHPVFSAETLRAQREFGAIQGRRRTWFAGAWRGHGFHEDGLKSAIEVVEGMGYDVPWRRAHLGKRAERNAGRWTAPALEQA
ncbi:MAG TPA: FAD-dependent oxidoreductase [Gammaproteobacteria bacterium]|nr:FAD-dependent oxidoreductase [Gammaproteobacteria bacterium]